MRLALVCVGKLKAGPERLLFDRYFKRLTMGARGAGLAGVDLREIGESLARRPDERRAAEGAAILAAMPKGAALILLDERGMGRRYRPGAGRVANGLCGGDRGTGRARPVARRPGASRLELRPHDLASSTGPGNGRRTALSRDDDSRRPPLSSRLSSGRFERIFVTDAPIVAWSRRNTAAEPERHDRPDIG
jgi:Predicted SPOUT methyltransferase